MEGGRGGREDGIEGARLFSSLPESQHHHSLLAGQF